MTPFRLTKIYFSKKFMLASAIMVFATILAVILCQSQIQYIKTHDQYSAVFSRLFSMTHEIEKTTLVLETAKSDMGSRTIALTKLKQLAWEMARTVKALQDNRTTGTIIGITSTSNMPETAAFLWAAEDGLAQDMLRFSDRINNINLTKNSVREDLVTAHSELEYEIQPRLSTIIDALQKASLDRILFLSTAIFVSAAFMIVMLIAVGYGIFRPMRDAILSTQSALSQKVEELKILNGVLAWREADAVYHSLHDDLTGLPNRRAFAERLDTIAQCAGAGGDESLQAVILVDLDRFKQINDTLGHHTGDAVLVAIAEKLGTCVPQGTLIARLGGDEFAMIVNAENAEAIDDICRNIIRASREPVVAIEQIVHCGVSVGVSVFDTATPTAFETLKRADLALYVAKGSGRNCYRIFVPKFAADFEHSKRLQDDLRSALSGDQIHLVYQPIVSHNGLRVLALEALMRWEHPELGAVPPAEFIGAAEESGQIRSLGAWALRQAMLDTQKFDNVPISFNLSPVQLRHRDFVDEVLTLADETGVNPANIEFEITESVLIDDAELARSVMIRLKDAGFSIALDDFGTGYSSFGYLRDFPFDKLKIDKSFVSRIDKDPEAAALVDAMINIGRALGINVVAEGVETEGERLILQAAGCTQMQGYLFCKPELVGHLQTVLNVIAEKQVA